MYTSLIAHGHPSEKQQRKLYVNAEPQWPNVVNLHVKNPIQPKFKTKLCWLCLRYESCLYLIVNLKTPFAQKCGLLSFILLKCQSWTILNCIGPKFVTKTVHIPQLKGEMFVHFLKMWYSNTHQTNTMRLSNQSMKQNGCLLYYVVALTSCCVLYSNLYLWSIIIILGYYWSTFLFI